MFIFAFQVLGFKEHTITTRQINKSHVFSAKQNAYLANKLNSYHHKSPFTCSWELLSLQLENLLASATGAYWEGG